MRRMAVEITATIEHWPLKDPAAMAKCLKDMSGHDYRGMVRVMPSPEAAAAAAQAPAGTVTATATTAGQEPVWDLELNSNTHLEWPPVVARVDEVVVYFGGVLQVMTVEQFTQEFGVAP